MIMAIHPANAISIIPLLQDNGAARSLLRIAADPQSSPPSTQDITGMHLFGCN